MGGIGISLNEVTNQSDTVHAGKIVHYFGALERAKVDSAARTCWPEPSGGWSCHSLDGLVTPDTKQPRSVWWAVKGYGDITGRLVNVKPGASVAGIAGQDAATAQARAVLGRNARVGANVRVLLTGLDHVAYLGQHIRVVAQRVPASGHNALAGLTKEVDTTVVVSGNQAAFTLPHFGGSDAYTIVLTPGQ